LLDRGVISTLGFNLLINVFENSIFKEMAVSAFQNEHIYSDLHIIGGWGSVLSSKHTCTPLKTI
jgi:hypothetical protein